MEVSKNIASRKSLVTGAAIGIIAGVYLWEFLSEKRKSTSIWKYQSNPPFPIKWDRAVRVLIDPLTKILAGGVVPHHWDWTSISDREEYSQNWYLPNRDNYYSRFGDKKLDIKDHFMAHLISGIQEVSVLSLDLDRLKAEGKELKPYHYAFQGEGQTDIRKCRILIPAEDKVRILVSTSGLRVLALDADHNELPSVVEGVFRRNDPKVRGFRQF